MSRRDSPFSTELPLAAKFSESADSHFSAVSKENRVRVDASKKRFTTIRPRSAGTFLISRCPIARIDSAVSRISPISPEERFSMPRRSFDSSRVVTPGSASPRGAASDPKTPFLGRSARSPALFLLHPTDPTAREARSLPTEGREEAHFAGAGAERQRSGGDGFHAGLSRIHTSSAPSVSWNMTLMTSRAAVGTLLPT